MKTSDPIAPLRTDLEVQHRPDDSIDVRDPHLNQVFTVQPYELAWARHFDGQRSAKQVAKALRKLGAPRPDTQSVLQVAEDLRSIDLLDVPEVWDKSPVGDNSTPYSIIECSTKALKVLPAPEPGARWSCGSCGACCKGLAVEVSDEEYARIAPELYEDILGDKGFTEQAFIDPERSAVRILRQRADEDGACIFLGADGLCAVHARQGMAAKPDACQMFPNMVLHTPDKKPRLAMRTNCRTMHESFETGQPVEEHRAHVLGILESSGSYKIPKKMHLFGEWRPFAKVDAIRVGINQILADKGVTAKALRKIDETWLQGRVKPARRAYAKNTLAYLRAEQDGEYAIQQGALSPYFRPVKRAHEGLKAMKKGKKLPRTSPRVQEFLRAQMGHMLYAAGPMTLPDAGLGYVALILAMEATLHTIGDEGSLQEASDALIAFTYPIIETTTHAWPILDALDAEFAQRLREEV